MGTISDKLMRIINTKEDIRQALISKGYDVPTSIPFKEYAKMISDLPCKVEDFPKLPGDVTRWHFGGLTNEMMAAMDDPRIEDADHKGRFLSFKNFAWSGMSGVGGYVQNFNYFRNNTTVDKVRIDEQSSNSIKVTILNTEINNAIYIPKNIYQFNKSYFIKISSEGYDEGDMALSFYAPSTSTATTVTVSLNPNGITEIPAIKEDDFLAVYLNVGGKVGSITIEQLPLYPGALVFDGIDDYGVCDNFPILTKEKGYTVVALRQWIEEKNSITALVSNSKNWNRDGAFVFEYNNLENNYPNLEISFGSNTNLGREKSSFTYQTSKLYNGKEIKFGEFLGSDKLIVAKDNENLSPCSNVAIWELVFLDHDATEEELTKIKDYFVKTYPWLFPDQAWTVTGKTNEDEDRATIANITGNGNDLVLSNSGFAEGSGYGLYAENYTGGRWVQSTYRADLTWTSYSVNITSVKVASTQLYYQSYPEQPSFTVPSYKIKVYGLKDGQTLSYKQVTSEGQQIYKISEDGIYTLPSFLFKANGDWYGFTLDKIQESCDITIEQIPEYEGYLVTDGVDDKIISSIFKMGNDWTVIGDWELINTGKNDNAGIVKFDSIVIYNYNYNYNSMLINIKNGRNILIPDQNTVNAICSDGRIYSKDWKESIYNEETESTSKNFLTIGYSGNAYTKIAFKNLAIYPTVLSREDCIKAYNYLQTLKAK